jgi:hypothetical protein
MELSVPARLGHCLQSDLQYDRAARGADAGYTGRDRLVRADTKFRYVLQPGETISASDNLPIGQVFFVPREEIAFRDGTEEEAAAGIESGEAFFREKVRTKIKTSDGLEYSPHYLRTSGARSATPESRGTESASSGIGPQASPDATPPTVPPTTAKK